METYNLAVENIKNIIKYSSKLVKPFYPIPGSWVIIWTMKAFLNLVIITAQLH